MKVIKDYGLVAKHGNRELKLQTYLGADKEKKLALISYKDGMSVRTTDITLEAKELKRLLEEYLGYKTPVKEQNNDVVKTLVSLPAGDGNYQTALKNATEDDLTKAIELMEKSGGKHATRIKACQSALKSDKVVKMPKKTATTEDKPKQTAKIINFPTEDKRPKVVKLVTEGKHTYEDCVAKLTEEGKIFKDSDSQYVIEGLLELCKVDSDFRNNVMREDKTYGGFMEYMHKAAQGGYCIKYGNMNWLDRDMGLGLAIDYYNTDTKKIEEEEKKKKSTAKKTTTKGKKTKKGV